MKKNHFILLFLVLIFAHSILFSQESNPINPSLCGTPIPDNAWENRFAELIQQTKNNAALNKQQNIVYTIPVIIHVIHGGEPVGTYPNLATGQLISQIQSLNNDYGGIGYNSSFYPLNAFTNYALNQGISPNNLDLINRIKIANCGIQFCLATKDTLGNNLAEPGIERISYQSRGWTNPATLSGANAVQSFVNGTVKPQTIWNVSKYLNIWVTDEVNNPNNMLLGYATFPALSGLTGFGTLSNFIGTSLTDGFWCYAKTFGSASFYPNGTYYANYTFGRTCTHEIGHWLGLRHIWGDANCGTDYCDDTPPAKSSNINSLFGYPYHPGTCNGNNPDGEMMMNFMDYTNDNAKYMFTTDQATRMHTALQNSPYRKFLGSHNLCSVQEIASNAKFATSATVCEGAALTLSNQSLGTPVPSFTWSSVAGAVFNPNNNSAYMVTFPAAGIYTITLTADNGTISTITRTVNVLAPPSLSLNPPRNNYCIGENITVDLQGASSYVWQPDSSLNSYIILPSDKPASFSYTCYVSGANTCKTNTVINLNVVDCTAFEQMIASEKQITLFPNPANSHLIVESNMLFNARHYCEIYNSLGQMLLKQQVDESQQSKQIKIDLTDLNRGVYFIKVFESSQMISINKLLIE